MTPRAPAAISVLLVGWACQLWASGVLPLLSRSAGATRVLYCSPWQANAVADVRGCMVEDCGIVGVGGYHARTRALR